MWIGDGGIVAYSCPVLDLRDKQGVIAKFDLCHETVGTMTGARIERRAMPVAGGVCQQPSLLMEQFALLERVANEELQEDMRLYRQRKEEEAHERPRSRHQD